MTVWFKLLSSSKDHGAPPRPTTLVRQLYDAQKGRCFHCYGMMVWGDAAMNYRDLGWSREHVYPRSAFPGKVNNIVLAHPPCNNAKGARMPTVDEIARTIALYAIMGSVAFAGAPVEKNGPRFALPGPPHPTIGDLCPKLRTLRLTQEPDHAA